jgi:translation initiation factor 2 subunit 3
MSSNQQTDNIFTKMTNQPILNIGCLGSVSDGKSTTVFQLTGTKTQRHSNEKTRNITIKPGYANMKVWLKQNGEYETTNSDGIVENAQLVHHLSFVDCPGHQELILTMMGSVSLMKGAIVVVSAAEEIKKKPQLIQHLAAAKMAGLERLVVIFNKLDLVKKEKAIERKEELDELLEKLQIKPKYIIPTALNKKIGLQNVIKAIMEVFPPELSNECTNVPEFRITRSFDINKPGIPWSNINGGVFGGSLINGQFKIGDEIEIRPGQWSKKKDGGFIIMPIKTKINSIQSDKVILNELYPGGLTAIGTNIDPFYCKDDKLSGSVVGLVGNLPNVYQDIIMKVNLTKDFEGSWEPKKDDIVYLQIGNVNTEATLTNIKNSDYTFKLSKPSCISENALILVCNNTSDILKIVGYGNIISEKSTVLNLI